MAIRPAITVSRHRTVIACANAYPKAEPVCVEPKAVVVGEPSSNHLASRADQFSILCGQEGGPKGPNISPHTSFGLGSGFQAYLFEQELLPGE